MTTAELARPTDTAPAVTADQLDLIRRTIAKDATPDELKLYLYDCARQGVHPLDKLIHYTKRSGKYTPITSIDFMRIRASESGEYAGSEDAVFTATVQQPAMFAATVRVWRLVQGQKCEFTATARWSEYKPEANDFMWRKMPHTMLGKCAEALALRKGFPRQLAGLYAAEEMDQASRPPSKPNEADAATPPVVNVTTGEEVTERPEAPVGYHYLALAPKDGDWHQFDVLRWDAEGGALRVSTKFADVADNATQAAEQGIPAQVKVTLKKGKFNGGYLNSVVLYVPDAEHLEPITADQIPF